MGKNFTHNLRHVEAYESLSNCNAMFKGRCDLIVRGTKPVCSSPSRERFDDTEPIPPPSCSSLLFFDQEVCRSDVFVLKIYFVSCGQLKLEILSK